MKKRKNQGSTGNRKIQVMEKRLKKVEEALDSGNGSSGGKSTTSDMSTDE